MNNRRTEKGMQALLNRIEELLHQGSDLAAKSKNVKESDYSYNSARIRWFMSCENFFTFAKMERFLQEFEKTKMLPLSEEYIFANMIGILQSAYDEINAGFISELKHLIHAEFFESIIEQAEELLGKGYKMPAAVLGRIIIERWLKDEAEKNNLTVGDKDKASKVNDQLKQGGFFSVPKWRQIQGFLDIGNSAAHGKNDEFTDDDVKRMFDFIKVNCL